MKYRFPWESGIWISVFGYRAIILYKEHIVHCCTQNISRLDGNIYGDHLAPIGNYVGTNWTPLGQDLGQLGDHLDSL